MSYLNLKNEIEYEEIIDKGSEIVKMKCNDEGTLLVYVTDNNKVYLYLI